VVQSAKDRMRYDASRVMTRRETGGSLFSDRCSLHCTTEQSNTHSNGSREILYSWHPWHGHRIAISRTIANGGRRIFCRKLENVSEGRSLEIPEWMFDVATCHNTRLSQTPTVSAEALLELKLLIAKPSMDGHGIDAEARHAPVDSTGGATGHHDTGHICRLSFGRD
jgi:hypothetical protein